MRFIFLAPILCLGCVSTVETSTPIAKSTYFKGWEDVTIDSLMHNCISTTLQVRMPSSHAPYFCECMVALLTENVTEKEYRAFDKETLNAVATVIGDTCMQVIFNQPKQEEPVL